MEESRKEEIGDGKKEDGKNTEIAKINENLKEELMKRKFSARTIKNYCFFTEKFLEFSNKSINELAEEDAKKYINSLTNKKSVNTIMLAAASVKFFYSKILKKETSIKLPKKEKKQTENLTNEEIKKLIENAETEKSHLIISILYSSGLKTNEIINLTKTNLKLNKTSGIIKKDDKKERFFLISSSLSDKLKNYIEKHPENKYIFSGEKPLTERNIQKIIKNLKKKAGIEKKITPLTFRNCFANYLLKQEINKKFIKALLEENNLQKFNGEILLMEQLKQIKNPLDDLFEEKNKTP